MSLTRVRVIIVYCLILIVVETKNQDFIQVSSLVLVSLHVFFQDLWCVWSVDINILFFVATQKQKFNGFKLGLRTQDEYLD